MATLKDVAERAGVSVSTVSLVLNGQDARRVKPAIGERVRQAADELGYAPNLLARSLRTRRTRTIGLLSDMVATTPFAGRMLKGAQETAWQAGYVLLLIDTGGVADLERSAVQALVQRNVDALVYACMYHREVEVPEIPEGLPVVVLDGRPTVAAPGERRTSALGDGRRPTPATGDGRTSAPAADWVVPDERGGARAAVEHLLAAGHRRIGFCTTGEDVPAARERLEAFAATLGADFDPSLVVRGETGDVHGGARATAELLGRRDRPSALFCFNDRMAMGAYRAARAAGLSIPADLSVVGFDDQEHVADALDPALTTVALPHYEMGAWAARRALARAASAAPEPGGEHALMPCTLVVRDSVAAL
ncbi:LacI family DNA-binding transcriptional regulator [Nonomuraea sp. SYSU D8015]|uniref:LacI family DNA-binding transcriptional regulator n=1 Tax=Nonomuraea sp. SYSU D8015 TaxID=2593644 RepID=UPI001660E6D2|nr:LacI family DNA-binding transcriptional regulator [Nonomuraea sp. SYSU D8015]